MVSRLGLEPMAVAPSPSGCFSFDAGKIDCYFMRLLTTSIHSNHRQSRQNISGLPYLVPMCGHQEQA
jgi:hypothetical protein